MTTNKNLMTKSKSKQGKILREMSEIERDVIENEKNYTKDNAKGKDALQNQISS